MLTLESIIKATRHETSYGTVRSVRSVDRRRPADRPLDDGERPTRIWDDETKTFRRD